MTPITIPNIARAEWQTLALGVVAVPSADIVNRNGRLDWSAPLGATRLDMASAEGTVQSMEFDPPLAAGSVVTITIP